jgi:hypothetical protein
LVAFGTLTPQHKASLVEVASTFKGDTTVASFRPADVETVRQIVRRFSPPTKRGPLAVPAIRLLVGDLVEGRTFVIERTPASAFAAGPERR